MKKIHKIIALIIALSLTLAFSLTTSAAQYGETINGVRYSASLTRNQTSATANTSCNASTAACYVTVTLRYYNKESVHSLTKYASGAGLQTASAYVNGDGTEVATLSATSQHTVYNGNITWSHSLSE